MKLTELNPSWVGAGGSGISDKDGNPVPRQTGVGMMFDCPCGKCGRRGFVEFSNPLDGSKPKGSDGPRWTREGSTFETLTLSPSIHRAKKLGGCGWHGWIKNGLVTGC